MPLTSYDNGDRNINKIALTFDDGPNPFWTEKVLDILDKHHIKANFFVLGKNAEKYGDIVKKAFKKGHLIGSHTYSHPREGIGDFEKAEEIIFAITGKHTQFIRPPYNNNELCGSYDPAVRGKVKIINNDVIPRDWNSCAEDIVNEVLKNTKNGSIILLHDGSQREADMEIRPQEMFKALPVIIEELKKKGFEFAKLDELALQ